MLNLYCVHMCVVTALYPFKHVLSPFLCKFLSYRRWQIKHLFKNKFASLGTLKVQFITKFRHVFPYRLIRGHGITYILYIGFILRTYSFLPSPQHQIIEFSAEKEKEVLAFKIKQKCSSRSTFKNALATLELYITNIEPIFILCLTYNFSFTMHDTMAFEFLASAAETTNLITMLKKVTFDWNLHPVARPPVLTNIPVNFLWKHRFNVELLRPYQIWKSPVRVTGSNLWGFGQGSLMITIQISNRRQPRKPWHPSHIKYGNEL